MISSSRPFLMLTVSLRRFGGNPITQFSLNSIKQHATRYPRAPKQPVIHSKHLRCDLRPGEIRYHEIATPTARGMPTVVARRSCPPGGAVRTHHNFPNPSAAPSTVVFIRIAACFSKPSGRLHSGVINTGRACDHASRTTRGCPSLNDGNTKASAFW